MRGDGSGTKRRDGRWQSIITLTDENGTKHRICVSKPTQRELQNEVARLRQRGLTKRTPFVESVWADFYASHVNPLAPKTRQYYSWVEKRIVAEFGEMKPPDIKAIDVRRWMDRLMLEGVSGRTIQMHRNCLRVFLGWCREQGLVEQDNAAQGVKLPKHTRPAPRSPLTRAMARLVRLHEPDPNLRLLWRLLGETGLRPSEALAVHGEDVSYQKGIAVLAVRGTKTSQSVRNVPIPLTLAALMPAEGLIFPWKLYTVEKKWREALERAGLPHTNLYQLRKLCLSEWARRGVPPEVLKTWAGHTDIALTHNVYVKIERADVLKAIEKSGLGTRYVNPLHGSQKRLGMANAILNEVKNP